MAIHYNLAKVYEISDNDSEFVQDIINLFVTEVPADLKNVKKGIKEKDYKLAYGYAHKIKPTLDLLGMTVAFEEILLIEDWTKREGKKKEIKETYKSIIDNFEMQPNYPDDLREVAKTKLNALVIEDLKSNEEKMKKEVAPEDSLEIKQ